MFILCLYYVCLSLIVYSYLLSKNTLKCNPIAHIANHISNHIFIITLALTKN